MELYVAVLTDRVQVYPLTASGDAPPARVLEGPSTLLDGVGGLGLDSQRRLHVGNPANSTITVYAADAGGDAPPIRRLAGPQTGLGIPNSLALDSTDHLYVLNSGGVEVNRTITVYAPGADGDTPPVRTLHGIEVQRGNLNGVTVDLYDQLYLSEDLPGIISVYAHGAHGTPTPLRRITGPHTKLSTVSGMDVDGDNYLYVANGDSVLVFAPDADGDAAPLRVIAGPHTGLTEDFDLAVEPDGTLYVANFSPQFTNGEVAVFAPGADGDTAPTRVITSFPAGVPVGGMVIDKPGTPPPPPPPRATHLGEIVGLIFGGIARDGDGIIVVNGHPHPVGPWGDRTVDGAARRDLLLSLVVEQVASRIGDTERGGAIRAAALELMRGKINEMIVRLP